MDGGNFQALLDEVVKDQKSNPPSTVHSEFHLFLTSFRWEGVGSIQQVRNQNLGCLLKQD